MNNFARIKVKIAILGHAGILFDVKKVMQHKSKFFEIEKNIEYIQSLPSSTAHTPTLDLAYSASEVTEIMTSIGGDLVIGIMAYRFDDRFYMHRTGDNKLCISLADINHVLLDANIAIENFITKNIYEAVLLLKLYSGKFSNDIYDFPHFDTRGCLFDMNGDKYHIVYNTEQPSLCAECKGKILRKFLPDKYLEQFEKELKLINKAFLLKIEIWVKTHPFLSATISFGISALIAFIINILTTKCFI